MECYEYKSISSLHNIIFNSILLILVLWSLLRQIELSICVVIFVQKSSSGLGHCVVLFWKEKTYFFLTLTFVFCHFLVYYSLVVYFVINIKKFNFSRRLPFQTIVYMKPKLISAVRLCGFEASQTSRLFRQALTKQF